MRLGKYEIISELGRGGFGIVYKAKDTTLDRIVALKVLHPQLSTDEKFIQFFQREARSLAKIDHPNVVTIHEIGEINGQVFIAMRYLAGGSLSDKMKREGLLPPEEVFRIMTQVAEGLNAGHKRGIIHQDVKPGNILFDEHGCAVIADFSIARTVQMTTMLSSGESLGVVGTPSYMAPEMWEGGLITPATDQYSLACVMYEMLTGDRLFPGDTSPVIMNKHFKPVVLPDSIPPGLRAILLKALAKEPEERFADLHELQRALEEFASRPVSAPPDKAREEVKVFPSSTDKKAKLPKPRQTKAEAPKVPGRRPPAWLPVALVGVVAVAAVAIFASLGKLAIPAEQTPLSELLLTPTAAQTSLSSTEPKNTSTAAPSSTPEPTAAPSPTLMPVPELGVGSTRVRETDGMEQVYVPEGSFEMGSTTGDEDEKPVRQVYLDAYWIDKFEVTNEQYAQCVAAGVCTKPKHTFSPTHSSYYGDLNYVNYPVIYVSWYQAWDYCQWVGGDLPTEAQWEKAARGTDARIYPWGNDSRVEIYVGIIKDTVSGGTYPQGASPYGALDMAGNVYEWVRDWYGDYDADETNNPTGPSNGNVKVIRGGSWYYSLRNFRATNRNYSDPTDKYYYIGFRCATSP
ncbi:MAG: Serine/threonine-protein kinase StkP [Chloroflexi bacterium ADurb.Bin360]|nr:MAG: Serine/threonine-protein kinase StkP [Chloroflexi bacterium ADurb.Bin360]